MITFKQIGLLLEVFQRGRAVANPVAWKHGQIAVTALAPVLVVAVETARAFGYNVLVTPDQCASIAGGIIAVVNILCTVATTTKIGVSPGELPPITASDNQSIGGATIDVDPPATRSDLGYERSSGPSAGDRAGG